MKTFMRNASDWSADLLGNGLLILTGIAVTICGVALLALYMANHLSETPGVIKIRCLIQPDYVACPARDDAIERLNDELTIARKERDRVEAERKKVETQIAGLRAIEKSVDRITLFKTHSAPNSPHKVVVGTVFRNFVTSAPKPESYFCYLRLPSGASGEDRLLDIRSGDRMIEIKASALDALGIAPRTVAFARNVCKPKLVAEE